MNHEKPSEVAAFIKWEFWEVDQRLMKRLFNKRNSLREWKLFRGGNIQTLKLLPKQCWSWKAEIHAKISEICNLMKLKIYIFFMAFGLPRKFFLSRVDGRDYVYEGMLFRRQSSFAIKVCVGGFHGDEPSRSTFLKKTSRMSGWRNESYKYNQVSLRKFFPLLKTHVVARDTNSLGNSRST